MRRPPFPIRPAALLALVLGSANAYGASPTKDQCIDAAEEGQGLRDKGRMILARARFLACSNAGCPGVVAKECTSWLNDIDARIPTVVLGAVDGSGGDLVEVKVSLLGTTKPGDSFGFRGDGEAIVGTEVSRVTPAEVLEASKDALREALSKAVEKSVAELAKGGGKKKR